MGSISLLHRGGVNRGALEKFADGMNFLGRGFWIGKTVKITNSENQKELTSTSKTKSISSKWLDQAFLDGGGVGAGVGLMFHGIAFIIVFIPLGLLTGIGCLAKKIALATNKNATLYHSISSDYLDYSKKMEKLTDLQKVKKSQENQINKKEESSKKEINQLNVLLNEINSGKHKNILEVLDAYSTTPVMENFKKKVKFKEKAVKCLKERFDKLTTDFDEKSNKIKDLKGKINLNIKEYNKSLPKEKVITLL